MRVGGRGLTERLWAGSVRLMHMSPVISLDHRSVVGSLPEWARQQHTYCIIFFRYFIRIVVTYIRRLVWVSLAHRTSGSCLCFLSTTYSAVRTISSFSTGRFLFTMRFQRGVLNTFKPILVPLRAHG